MKMIKIFQMKIVILTPVKNRCMLHHGRVFVMKTSKTSFDVYDADSPAGEVWLFNFYFQH